MLGYIRADPCPAHIFFLLWYWLTIFGIRIYHESMCRVHSWSLYDVDLWPWVFEMSSCTARNVFLLWHWLNIFDTLVYHPWVSRTFMIPIRHWPWPQSQIYRGFDISSFLTCNFEFCLLWHSQFIFDTWVYHLERMCCVHSLSRYKVRSSLLGLDMSLWATYNFCLPWHLHTTYVYRHERMCHINTWPLHDIDLWPQIKILFFYHEFVSRQVLYMYRYTFMACVWTWCLV